MKKVVYTAIPKFLVYYNLEIGAYVENQGFTANTPWQYTYAMGDKVHYDNLKKSLGQLVKASDQMWVFSEASGTFPKHEELQISGLGLTDGIVDELEICYREEIPVKLFRINAETGEITERESMNNFNLGVILKFNEE